MDNFVRVISDRPIPNELSFLQKLFNKLGTLKFEDDVIEGESHIHMFHIKQALSEEEMEVIVTNFFAVFDTEVFFENNAPIDPLTDLDNVTEQLSRYLHEKNLADKLDAGWTYGEEFSFEKRTSPLLLPWNRLPSEHKKLRPDIVNKVIDLISEV